MLLTIKQVAERLNCAESTVYALVSTGKISGFRIGANNGGIRISEEDLQLYLDSCRIGETAKEEPRKAPPRLKHLKL
ncbi:helix-turn-helix domain-containing protein [Blastopirellula marina]|uniref:Helix-turn-helix domain-containing protein n=1 Tax=Blastopirellula marina TaxID=124 RepID=A0A2S8GSF5_9BACT|nr:helix-turn-helix domain-containing protein [Blastopirellula marina]PQO47352.1 hypothetical protein C5Y93_04740 [Blastopirellula marina]